MNSDRTENIEALVVRLRDTLNKTVEHAVQYKALFHSMQEELGKAQGEIVRRGHLIKQQRRVIAELESELGYDQDL
jgi:hypothetical protein